MKKTIIDYSFTTLDNIHTGADKSFGIFKALYREKCKLPYPISVSSIFPQTKQGNELKRKTIALLFFMLYDRIENKRTSIWDEITDALIKVSACQTKEQVINSFAEQFEIRNIIGREISGWSIPKILNLFDDRDLLETIRKEYHYIAALMYEFKEEKKEKGIQSSKNKSNQVDIFAQIVDDVTGDINKIQEVILQINDLYLENNTTTLNYNYDYIPVIKGNSIRGILRDLAMADYLKAVDLYEDNAVNKHLYNKFFGGGTLSNEKDVPKKYAGTSGLEDLDLKNLYFDINPIFGVLGGAISSNQMIEGELRRCEYAVPKVKELGTGEASHHEIVTRVFNVRQDDSKKTTLILRDEKSPVAQMKFEYECYIRGTEFSHGFTLLTHNKLRESAFWRLMELFTENNVICAKSAVGLGKIDLSELATKIPEGASDFYQDYLRINKSKIQDFLED